MDLEIETKRFYSRFFNLDLDEMPWYSDFSTPKGMDQAIVLYESPANQLQ